MHGLGTEGKENEVAENVYCLGCNFPFFVLDEVSKLVENDNDALEVVENCRKNFSASWGIEYGR